MAKRKPTRYDNVFYLDSTTNGKDDKTYYIRYRDEHGKQRELKVGRFSEGIRENYCNQKLIETLNNIRLGEQPPIIKARHKKVLFTLDDLAKQYFASKPVDNKTTHRTYGKYNLHIKPLLGNKDITYITKNDILSIQSNLLKIRAPKTVNSYIQLIKSMFIYAINEELYTGANPTKGIQELKIDNTRERFLTLGEIKELLEATKPYFELYVFVLLSLSTGGRLGTVMNIEKKDIDFENKTITLKDIKNDSTYKGFFDDTLLQLLAEHTKALKSYDKVIGMNERAVRRKLATILNELFNEELDKDDRKNRVVIHTLRHTFASQLAIKGTPIFTIQKLLNHNDIKHTMRYAKLAPDSGREMVDSFTKSIYT
ncbi:MAG: site-specific integrase [Campylobacterales bacterium]|nr:site-specific integrase [Campylobacterales bacterium]